VTEELKADPRTAWAFHVYQSIPHNPPITMDESARILEGLHPDEHAELILRGRELQSLLSDERHGNEPTGVAIRTLTRTLLVSPGTGELIDRPHKFGMVVGNRGGERAPAEQWSRSHDFGAGGIQLFTPTDQILHCFKHGAGLYILRVPSQPGVPDMPEVSSAETTLSSQERYSTPAAVNGWESVEEIAEAHMRELGFAGVVRTSAGRDGGLDVVGHGIAAQVKMMALPVGRPVLQQLVGAAGAERTAVCYSTSGFTSEATLYAQEHGVALFGIDSGGRLSAQNLPAEVLERVSGSTPEALQWRVAYGYQAEVEERAAPFLRPEPGKVTKDSTEAYQRGLSYYFGAKRAFEHPPRFTSARHVIVHYHHAEQLTAIWVRCSGGQYPTPPRPVERPASTLDFY
jgi:hypothetical protein